MSRLSLLALALLLAAPTLLKAAPLNLCADGRSAYVIYCDPTALPTARQGAAELQRVLEISTGVKLPVVETPRSPMIAVGDSPAAAQAGLVGKDLPMEGCRLLTRGADLFIVGRDVDQAAAEWDTHLSQGTEYGVYAFLEDVVGARWLMPGPVGEDIPRHATLQVPETDRLLKPTVPFRALAYVQDRGSVVRQWKDHNRVHTGYRLSFGHAWDDHPPFEQLKQHPEWMVMNEDGTRQPVTDDKNRKYCLSNQELVRAYADSVNASFDKNPRRWHASLSPSDGGGFCQCPDCRRRIVRDDKGKWANFASLGWSMTPQILDFYNAVGRQVAAKHPRHVVGGLVYYYYTYPPDEVVKMEPNVILDVAVLDYYGYHLYKPELQKPWPNLLPEWSKFTPNLAWSDYSTWMREPYGLPLPPGRPILKALFSSFAKTPLMCVNYTGHSAWGTGAVHNYLLSKLMWNPSADVDALYAEFLRRAYGEAAAPLVDQLYTLSEEVLSEYVRSHSGYRQPSYDSNYELVKLYAPHYATLERLYTEALGKTQTEGQRQRLQMLGAVLTVLNHNLRSAGLLRDEPGTALYKTAEAYREFLQDPQFALALNEDMKPDKDGRLQKLFAPEGRVLQVPRLAPDVEAPKLDGDLGDLAWTVAASASGFRRAGTREEATVQTQVRLAYDKDALYVSARCLEPNPAGIRKTVTGRDVAALFDDDTFELLFSNKINYKINYWHLGINPNNAVYDDVALDRDYNLQFRSATAVGADAWTVEIAIPFASMNLSAPPAGQSWKVNFCRVRRQPPPEYSVWSAVKEGFHDPDAFAEMQFAAK